MSELKDIRKEKNMTQQEVANLVGVSVRSYKDYENDSKKENTLKYKYILEKLMEHNLVDEEHGVLTIDGIKNICSKVFDEYDVHYCYLFGSYAKGKANETSDIDLLISCNVKGLQLYGLVEKLRESLHKKVDLIEVKQLRNNIDLAEEVLNDGVRIYG